MIVENMEQQPKIKIAIQKKGGRLYEPSVVLLRTSGFQFSDPQYGQVSADIPNSLLKLFYLRDDDIPKAVSLGRIDFGIVANHVVKESQTEVTQICELNFGRWPLVLAVKNDSKYYSLKDLEGKIVATSYPKVTENFFRKKQIQIVTSYWSGSVEAAIELGDAQAISDISVTGKTLAANDLRIIDNITESVAVLIANNDTVNSKPYDIFIKDFLDRIKSANLRTKYE